MMKTLLKTLFVITLTTTFATSQNPNRSSLMGTYYSSSGSKGRQTAVETEPEGYKLKLKSSGKYIYKKYFYKEKYSKKHFGNYPNIKKRRRQHTLRGRWTLSGDSVLLVTGFYPVQKAYFCQFHDSIKTVSGSTKCYYYLIGTQNIYTPNRNR